MTFPSVEVIGGEHVSEEMMFCWPADFNHNSELQRTIRSLQKLSESDKNNIVLAGSSDLLGQKGSNYIKAIKRKNE